MADDKKAAEVEAAEAKAKAAEVEAAKKRLAELQGGGMLRTQDLREIARLKNIIGE